MSNLFSSNPVFNKFRFFILALSTSILPAELTASPTVTIDLNLRNSQELNYTEIRETKKWVYDEIETAISLEIPITCVITPAAQGYEISWRYGKAKISDLVSASGSTVSKELLALVQNTAWSYGEILIAASPDGGLLEVSNLSAIRKAVKDQIDGFHRSAIASNDEDLDLVLGVYSGILELSDSAISEAILAEIKPYFDFYGRSLHKTSLNIDEIYDPHPAYKQFKVRLVSEIESPGLDQELNLTRFQTDVLDEKGLERELQQYEPITEWVTSITFASTTRIIKSFEDIREFETQNEKFTGRLVRILRLSNSSDGH